MGDAVLVDAVAKFISQKFADRGLLHDFSKRLPSSLSDSGVHRTVHVPHEQWGVIEMDKNMQ